jgi:hypothetical protein
MEIKRKRQPIHTEFHMPEEDLTPDADAACLLAAALGGMTPHEALIRNSLAEAAKVDERKAAIARNRERALKLLEALEKSQDKA